MAEVYACANTIIYILCITRRIGLLGFVTRIPGSYGYRSLEIIYYIKDIQAPTDIPVKNHF